ncbi:MULTISPECIES: hypothetical protein [unclassified Cupriavidus]|uniref:hypothetical protein n=1 Tax=unclassified Cupriavidus TaxID=2640874 RepID=UPI0010F74CF2|nr:MULTISPECIES: hypothetical protein [unclassified Cupriavidus]MWL87715.1 hypothetical protein [Cupriavidus sp. SW-Y-13]
MSLCATTKSTFLETSRRYLLTGAIAGTIGGALTGALMLATPLGDVLPGNMVQDVASRAIDAMSGGILARL